MSHDRENLAGSSKQPIAIVGMACRFPGGATSPSKLWDLCTSGRNAWSTFPRDRFDGNSLYDTDPEKIGRHHVRGGYFLEADVARFDAGFFNLPAEVANALDPQIRQLLEVVYETIEDAGIPLQQLSGSSTSVFTGNWGTDYQQIQTRDVELVPGPYITTNTSTFIASRISHFFDLQGPSMSLDTACSSGLVALHQGCQSIWSGQSSMSIVGASSLILGQDLFVSGSTLGLLGPDGRCYAWDTRAQGYGRGEGVAALLLKPLGAALRDGDRVHAVVRDTGVNQDGKTSTITSPSMEAQRALIESCYRRAGLDMAQTGCIEAHMTGTQVGDVVEAEALGTTFGAAYENAGPKLLVGSVKTNIGHTEPVSGLAAVIKAAMAMKHRQIAPNQNYSSPNPKIKLDEWRLKVPTTLTEWPHEKAVRTSINNFGAGGTNAHVILDGAPSPSASTELHPADSDSASRVYVLGAGDSEACLAMARGLAVHLRDTAEEGSSPLNLRDLAHTLTERRSRLAWATAVRARSVAELVQRLDAPKLSPMYSSRKRQPRLGFVFNGQGAQWHAMGRELIEAYPVFGRSIRRAQQVLRDYGASWDLHAELLRGEHDTRVAEINIAQPISVALQLSLVDLLSSWGIRPAAVTSHSSGEIAAAYAIGALTFEQALGVVYFRGELALQYHQQGPTASPGGGMLAVGVGADDAERYIAAAACQSGRVVVACINSPASVTLSGDLSALDEVAARLDKDGVFARRLKVPLAYHSHHMLPMEQAYIDKLRSFLPEHAFSWDNSVLFASPVTGTLVSSHVLTPEHWARNLTSPVRFGDAFASLCGPDANVDVVVEIGAHSTLSGPIRQILDQQGRKMIYTSCLKRSTDAVDTMQDLVCGLVCCGYPVNLNAVNGPLDDAETTHSFVPDLPSYPWNHSTRYWLESRTNKETRYKKFPPHELLGLPISGDAGAIPTWRNFLRISDLPWLLEHQVDSKIVLPGAAYVAMAIEAVRLITTVSAGASSPPVLRGFLLREVNIMNPLIVTETSEGVEVDTRIEPCSETELDHRGWYEFTVSSVDAGGMRTANCRGHISPRLDSINKSELYREIDGPLVHSYFDASRPVHTIDTSLLYSNMRDMGIYHGPEFQNLVECHVQETKALCTVSLPSLASNARDYVVHPTTLDTIIQSFLSAVPRELRENNMLLPRSIGRIYVPSDLDKQAGSQLRVFTELKKSNKKGFLSSAAVSNAVAQIPSPSPWMRIDDFHFQAVPLDPRDDVSKAGTESNAPVCFKTVWEPDVLHAIPPATKQAMEINLDGDEAELERKLLRSSFDFIHDTVLSLKDEPKEGWAWHHQTMYRWMEHIVTKAAGGELGPGSKTWSRASGGIKQRRSDELAATGACGKLTVKVGRRLAAILRGEVAPLEVMMEDNLLHQYYMEMPRLKSRTYKHLAQVVELYAVKNPGAKVLEIGGGTAGATQTVLEAFGSPGNKANGLVDGNASDSVLEHYTFTDISGGFFPAAREKLARWVSMIDFAELDIEADPAGWSSSLELGSYDLVVASLVLHATKNLKRTMNHVRQLLKPGGKLLMIEATQDQLDTQLIFGTYEGWWLSEEPNRKHSPNAGLEVWEETLKDTGFSGIDFHIGDCEQAQLQSLSVILATAVEQTACFPAPVSIVYTAEPPHDWLVQLKEAIRGLTGRMPTVDALSSLSEDDAQGKICVFVAEISESLLDGIDLPTFERLRSLVTRCHGLLWLSCGGLVDSAHPTFSQTQGFLRTLRLENLDCLFVHLDFEGSSEPWSEDKIPFILRVLGESFDTNRRAPGQQVDWEYAVKDSRLHIPRVYPANDVNSSFVTAGNNHEPTYQTEPFHQPGRTLVWEPSKTGMLSNLVFADGTDVACEDVPHGMVQIEPKAFGLNFRDVMIALAQLDDTLTGHDVCGVVTGLGPGTEQSGLQVGDRVCGIGQGRFANVCRAYWTGVAKLPDELSWMHGAAIPVVYITAYHCLVRLGGLQRGQTVLIHAAAGGVGEAAIVVAQHVGARVLATCSSEAKKKLLVDDYDIDPRCIFSSRDDSFAPAVMAATGGKGVDVVLNSLSSSLLKATWACIARFGRFIEIGKVDIEAGRSLNMAPFGRCALYAGFDALQLNEYDGQATREALVASIDICRARITCDENGRAPLHPIAEYPIGELERAMRQMQSGLHAGKLVLVPRPGDLVNVATPIRTLAVPDATYMIVGGAGGVGLAIASWIVSRGAKHLILTSRHAESTPDALKLVETARAEGCNVHLRNCDASEERDLKELLIHFSAKGLPPVRGVINAAMVLKDSVFEQMSLEQWRLAVKSKVDSSMNLHKHLPPDLDFFVLLSSIVGQAGNVSQANYAAGNSFEDGLARHRAASLGQVAVSLNLPSITDVGFVANHAAADGTNQVQSRVEGLGTVSLAMDQLLRVLEGAVMGTLGSDGVSASRRGQDAQLILGLRPWDSLPETSSVRRDRRFGTLRLTRNSGAAVRTPAASAETKNSATGMLLHALSMAVAGAGDAIEQCTRAIAQAVAERLAVIFNVSVAQVDCAAPMAANAVDSLVAVELRNWLAASAKAKVSIFEVVQSRSLLEFASLIRERSII